MSEAFYGAKWVHDIVGKRSPTDSTFVKNVFEGAKRKLAKPVVKKESINIDILNPMYDNKFDQFDLSTLIIITMRFLSYAGFFRNSEVFKLLRSDVQILPTHKSLFIQQSKTDVYRHGAWTSISRTGGKLCPVHHLELYLKFAEIKAGSAEFIIRNIKKRKEKFVLSSENRPLNV